MQQTLALPVVATGWLEFNDLLVLFVGGLTLSASLRGRPVFVVDPVDVVGFAAVLSATAAAIAGGFVYAIPIAAVPVLAVRAIRRHHLRANQIATDLSQALCAMLRRAHPCSDQHVRRVADLAEAVALRLGVKPARATRVRMAAMLHDVGKVAVDAAVLDKPGPLDIDELAHVRRHAEFGATILGRAPCHRDIAEWVRMHHERPDGAGYPRGLPNKAIPVEAKIIAVVDAFDAMVGGGINGAYRRTYRAPMHEDDALDELRRCAGSQFDPEVVDAFCREWRRLS